MSIKQPSDSAVRLAAIDPTHSFIIQAPAGSGKTELLTDRILALLATVNRPEEIVAITFTRKAASEMHARVLAKLRAGEGPCPTEPHRQRSWQLAQQAMQRNRDLGWNLLQYPARLSVRTIDSLCAYLVRAMPWLSSLGGLPAIIDDAREHYEAAAQATLDMADENEAVATLIAHLDVDVGAAQDLLAKMLASRDQWLPVLARGSDVDQLLLSLERAVQSDLKRLSDAMPAGWAQVLAPCLSRAARVLDESGPSDIGILRDWNGDSFGHDAASLPQWKALACALLTTKNTLRRTVNIKQGFEARSAYKDDFLDWIKAMPESAPWLDALIDIRCAPDAGYEAGQEEVLATLLEVLWIAAAQLNLRFTEVGEVDFAEISQRALQALGRADDPSELMLALDNVIKHILVDEFQDTSQSQIELLERLTAGWTSGDGRSLFLVGDPMQSIYRFRKADVGCFLRVKAQGLGHVSLTPLELKDNFRSQAKLVDWVNSTCRPLFPKEDHPGLGAIQYTDSVAFNDPDDGVDVEFHPVWKRQNGGVSQSDDAVPAAEAVAIQLAKEALQRYPDSEHPVAILVRARTHLDDLVHRLAAENIPCRAVELVSLRSRQVVIDLTQLARALSHAADRLAWLSVLRSPLCGLSLAGLHALCGADLTAAVPALLAQWRERDARGESQLDPDESLRLRHAAAVLLDDSNSAGTIPFAAWLEHCWQRLGGAAIYGSESDAADAESLFRLIEKLAPYGNLDPVDLDARLAKLYAAPNSSGRAVEVMTIHKSKGLEFDTVIIAGLHRRPMSDAAPLVRFEHSDGELLLGPIRHRVTEEADPVTVYLAERDKKRAAYEADRLLYVALTRARRQLHLVGIVELDDGMAIKDPPAGSLLARLWSHMQKPVPPEASELAVDAVENALPGHQRLLVRTRIDALPATSVTAVVPPSGTPWQWRAESGAENIIGTVAHAWLERIGTEGLDAWSADRVDASMDVFRKQLSRAGLAPSAVDGAATILRDTLAATLGSERGRWLLQVARAHREWSLLDLSGRVSVIDLAISQEHEWLVVDYKTGVPRPEESLDGFIARMRERYREQIQRYRAHVTAFDGRPARGALYFPRVDAWVEYSC